MPGARLVLGPALGVPEPAALGARPRAAQVTRPCGPLTRAHGANLQHVAEWLLVWRGAAGGPLGGKERASLAVRGASIGAAPGPYANPEGLPVLQLGLQNQGPRRDARQLDPPLGGPPGGLPHVLAAATLGESAGSPARAGTHPSAGGEAMEETLRDGPGAGRKIHGKSSSQYRCSSQPFWSMIGTPHTLVL